MCFGCIGKDYCHGIEVFYHLSLEDTWWYKTMMETFPVQSYKVFRFGAELITFEYAKFIFCHILSKTDCSHFLGFALATVISNFYT